MAIEVLCIIDCGDVSECVRWVLQFFLIFCRDARVSTYSFGTISSSFISELHIFAYHLDNNEMIDIFRHVRTYSSLSSLLEYVTSLFRKRSIQIYPPACETLPSTELRDDSIRSKRIWAQPLATTFRKGLSM